MKPYLTYQIDVFTTEKFKGNPAGVMVNADGLSDTEMQLIARELNNSETAFILSSNSKDYDGVIRYFTPTTEVPICGHATIAAIYVKALEEQLNSCVLNMKTSIGILPIEVVKNNSNYQIIMTQGKFELSPEFNVTTTEKLLNALGLQGSDRDKKYPIQIASTGHSKVMIGIKSNEKLNQLTPNMDALERLSEEINCNGYFVFTLNPNNKNVLTNGRMFAPAIGIHEDPVTGNANGPLGGYLVQNKIINFNGSVFEFTGRQGEKMQRSGDIFVRVETSKNIPTKIQIKGSAVPVFKTTIEI
ncbi:PhzF family phenazine biosynthesis protein [Tenacibaculum gallaicum]|uniref:PhzF family phenazine biosynthesis protein n=1 Tax=Tenacibaculum gallaicum TaxID=561505 RepID=A0A3E0I7Z7_9FLAO|nr:PhzF family isomerase [Tenacibaculum gallaicum]REH54873.1 PhzF family phenazine biosynthesis protein [Tenacibaculum gallaicum]